LLTFSPESRAKDAYVLAAEREPDCQHTTIGFAKPEESLLAIIAVSVIYGDDALGIGKAN
jgi:hypothetical protein